MFRKIRGTNISCFGRRIAWLLAMQMEYSRKWRKLQAKFLTFIIHSIAVTFFGVKKTTKDKNHFHKVHTKYQMFLYSDVHFNVPFCPDTHLHLCPLYLCSVWHLIGNTCRIFCLMIRQCCHQICWEIHIRYFLSKWYPVWFWNAFK